MSTVLKYRFWGFVLYSNTRILWYLLLLLEYISKAKIFTLTRVNFWEDSWILVTFGFACFVFLGGFVLVFSSLKCNWPHAVFVKEGSQSQCTFSNGGCLVSISIFIDVCAGLVEHSGSIGKHRWFQRVTRYYKQNCKKITVIHVEKNRNLLLLLLFTLSTFKSIYSWILKYI